MCCKTQMFEDMWLVELVWSGWQCGYGQDNKHTCTGSNRNVSLAWVRSYKLHELPLIAVMLWLGLSEKAKTSCFHGRAVVHFLNRLCKVCTVEYYAPRQCVSLAHAHCTFQTFCVKVCGTSYILLYSYILICLSHIRQRRGAMCSICSYIIYYNILYILISSMAKAMFKTCKAFWFLWENLRFLGKMLPFLKCSM